MIDSREITVVFQGGINTALLGSGRDDGSDFLYNVAQTRKQLPLATIILSTWDSLNFSEPYNNAEKLGIDKLVLSPDPGGLPNIKFGYDTPNNVNRQIVSSQAGIHAVTTEYTIKLRSDSYLTSDHLLTVYQAYQNQVQSLDGCETYSPIIVPHLFTIDPSVYEHMAYHVSDWAQFGQTHTLQEYWSATWMSEENARYFEKNAQNSQASYGNDAFRTRLAVEQHLATQYASVRGYTVPTQYNQITDEILQDHQDFLATHIIVLDTIDFGLALPKYDWALHDDFMRLNCLNHDDWYQLFANHWQLPYPDSQRLANAQVRDHQKSAARQAFKQKMQAERKHWLSRLYPPFENAQ